MRSRLALHRPLVAALAGLTLAAGIIAGAPTASADNALPWQSLGAGVVDDTSFWGHDQVARNADGRPEYFAIKDSTLVHDWLQGNGAWIGWVPLGSPVSVFTVTNEADGRLRVLAVFDDGTLHTVAQNCPNCGWGGWSGDLAGGIGLLSRVTAGIDTAGRLQAFVIGGDKRSVYQVGETAANGAFAAPVKQWTLPIDIGYLQLPATVAHNADGRPEVFLPLSDGRTWHAWQWRDGTWSGWSNLNNPVGTPVQVTNEADGTVAVYSVRYTGWHDNALHRISQNCPNCGWQRDWSTVGTNPPAASQFLMNDVTVARHPDGRLEVYALADGPTSTDTGLIPPYGLFHLGQVSPQGAWSSWEDQGPMPHGWYQPTDVNTALGPDGRLWLFTKAWLDTDRQDTGDNHVFAAKLS
jgi:ribosomal protein S27AE